MAFDVEGALKAGYSEQEVADYLGQQKKFDTSSALKAGYTPTEIIQHLSFLENKSKERSWGEAASDIGASAKAGLGSLLQFPGQMYGLATGDFAPTGLYGYGKELEQRGEAEKSAGLKAREADVAAKAKEAEEKHGALAGAWEQIKGGLTDPGMLTSFLAQQAPSQIPTLVAGLLTSGAAAPEIAAMRTAASKMAEGAAKTAAMDALKTAEQRAVTMGTRAAVGTGAVQQGADIGTGAYEDLYKKLKDQGATDTEAAAKALSLARQTGASGAIISALAQNLPGAHKLESIFAGQKQVGSRLGSALGTGLGEALGETVEEGGGKFAQNLAMKQVDPTQKLMEGVGSTAGQAALGGFGMGALGGAAARRGAAEEEPSIVLPPAPPASPAAAPAAPTPPTYGELVQTRERLKQQEKTPEVIAELKAVNQAIKESDIAAIQQDRAQQAQAQQAQAQKAQTQQEQAAQDAQKAANSAFSQPGPQQLSMRGLEPDYQLKTPAPETTAAPAAAPAAPTIDQAQLTLPGFNAPITQADILNTGIEHGKGVKKWLTDNVVGKTTDEVKAMVEKDPTLLSNKGQRAQVLKELLNPAPEVAPYKEAENVAKPVSESTGTSAVVASQPNTGTTTAKPARVEPSGVAVAQQPAGKPVVGEGPQSGALTAQKPNYAHMGTNELQQTLENANTTNHALDLAAISKHFGSEAAEAYDKMNNRQRNAWWDKNATEALERDSSVFKGVNEEEIQAHIDTRNRLDDSSAEALGRSIALMLMNSDESGYIGSPEYGAVRHAINVAREKGFDENVVLAAARQRARERAGSDAEELFPNLFKQTGTTASTSTQPAAIQTDSREQKLRDHLQSILNDPKQPQSAKYGVLRQLEILDQKPNDLEDRMGRMEKFHGLESPAPVAAPEEEKTEKPSPVVNPALGGDAQLTQSTAPAKAEAPVAKPAERTAKNAFEAAATRTPLFASDDPIKQEADALTKARESSADAINDKDAALADAFARKHNTKNPNSVGATPATSVEAPLQGHITQGGVRSALETIANHTGTVYNALDKLIARRLLNASSLPTVEVVPEGHLGKDVNGDTVAATYYPVKDHIKINESHVGGATLLHELVHAFLHRLISSHLGEHLNHPAIRGLNNVYNYVKRVAPHLAEHYGMSNLSEFASETMSNKAFQDELHKIPYQRTNAFTAFAKKVLQAIGLQPNEQHTALAAALIHSEAALSEGRKMQEQNKGMSVQGLLGNEANLIPTSIEKGAEYLIPQSTTFAGAVKTATHSVKETLVGKEGIGLVSKLRVQAVDRFAVTMQRLQEAKDKKMAAILGKPDAAAIARKAQDVDRMVQPWFQTGALRVDPTTRGIAVEKLVDKNGNEIHASQVFPILQSYAKKNGLNYERGYAIASHILEGMRVSELVKNNATQGMDVVIHKGWRENNDPKGKIDMQKIRDAEHAYNSSPELKQLSHVMDTVRIDMINELEKAGYLNSEDAKLWREAAHYVPFDRIDDFNKGFRTSKRTGRQGLAQLSQAVDLTGSATRDVKNVFENYFKTMGWMADQLAKQNANSYMLNMLTDIGIGTKPARTRNGMEHAAPLLVKGEQFYVGLPTVWDTIPFIDKTPPKANYVVFFGKMVPVTRKLVTANPAFALKQVVEDVQGALITSQVHNPLRFVYDAFANFGKLTYHEIKGFIGDVSGRTPKMHGIEEQMRKLGLAGEVDYTSTGYNPGESLMYDLGIRERGKWGAFVHRLERITHGSDLAVRKALYDDEMRASKNQNAALAETKARELINFRRRGANQIVRDLVSVVPFMNATLQSLDVTYRAATGIDAPSGLDKAAAQKLFLQNMAIYAGLSLIYAIAKSGDDDYEKMNRRMRDQSWVMGDGVRIPVRGDMAITKVAIENMVGYFHRQGTPEEQLASEAVGAALAYAWNQTGDRVLGNTIPLALRPLFELTTNHSFLTGRELEGTHQKQEEPFSRRAGNTSETAIAVAKFAHDEFGVQVSPIHIDTVLNSYFGTIPAMVNMFVNQAINPGKADTPYAKLLGLSAYYYDEANLTNPKDEFYALRERVLPKLTTLNDLAKTDMDAALRYQTENANDLMLAKPVQHALSELSKTRAYRNFLESPQGAEEIPDSAERTKQIRDIGNYENELVGWVREAEKMVRQ